MSEDPIRLKFKEKLPGYLDVLVCDIVAQKALTIQT